MIMMDSAFETRRLGQSGPVVGPMGIGDLGDGRAFFQW